MQQPLERPQPERWFRQAAEAGDPDAAHGLGRLLEERGATAEAEEWYRKAAEAGLAAAANSLAGLLDDRGDEAEAETWYMRAAEAGDPEGLYNLGALLARRGDVRDAERWFRVAAKGGDLDAIMSLAALCHQRGAVSEAEHWWRRAALAGNADAAFNVGAVLERRGEREEAEHWYERGADAGKEAAVLRLARLLERRGEKSKADDRLRRAAEAGTAPSALALGQFLERAGDHDEAAAWLGRAAEAGSVPAAAAFGAALADHHAPGRLDEAERWLRVAADGGDEAAGARLDKLRRERSAEDTTGPWPEAPAPPAPPAPRFGLGPDSGWPPKGDDPSTTGPGPAVGSSSADPRTDPPAPPPPAPAAPAAAPEAEAPSRPGAVRPDTQGQDASPGFRRLLGENVAGSLSRQRALGELLGDHRWFVDVEKGTVDFGQGRVHPIQLLGTESTVSGTWLWSWANDLSRIPDPVLRAARRLRDLGEEAGIPELTRPLFPLAPEGGHLLALAASGICQADGYYRGPYANGAVYFLVFETGLFVPPRSAQEIAITLQGVVMTFAVDHRLMAGAYLRAEGFSIHDEGRMLHARADDGRELAVVFDDTGRMMGVTALA